MLEERTFSRHVRRILTIFIVIESLGVDTIVWLLLNNKDNINLPKAGHQKQQVHIKAGSLQKQQRNFKHKLNINTAVYYQLTYNIYAYWLDNDRTGVAVIEQ